MSAEAENLIFRHVSIGRGSCSKNKGAARRQRGASLAPAYTVHPVYPYVPISLEGLKGEMRR